VTVDVRVDTQVARTTLPPDHDRLQPQVGTNCATRPRPGPVVVCRSRSSGAAGAGRGCEQDVRG